MADIRINALATTAASTASDDFVAVDGSANGTRKLNAFSPTFGGNVAAIGNLTVSGAINVAGNVLGTSTGNDEWKILRGADTNYSLLTFRDTAGNNEWVIGRRVDSVAGAGNFSFYSTSLGANALTLALVSGNATLAGNLTVSGGTAAFSTPSGSFTLNYQIAGSALGSVIANSSSGEMRTSMGPSAGFGGFHTWYTDTAEKMRLFANGNLFIGASPVDGGQKLQVSGAGYFSGNLIVGSGSGTIRLAAGDGSKGQYTTDGTDTYLDYIGSIAIRSLPTYNTALALDSSQNATFAGQALSSVNASTATNLGSFVASNATLNAFVTYTSGASADQKYWSWQSGSAVGDGVFRLRALNDAGTNGKNAIVVKRTGISSVIVNLPSLPTSSAGLAAGDLWNDSGTVKVV